MMMTGRWRMRCLCISAAAPGPESPGMRMSLTTTCGVSAVERAASASCADEKVLNAMFFARERLLEHPADRAVVVR